MAEIDPRTSLKALRAAKPLVHCITNYVAMNVAANTLLAAGASPAMVHTCEEAGDFAGLADALTINIGTLSPHWVEGMKAAITAANASGKPWVLDPVAHFATAYRNGVALELLALEPTIVRGNASEIMALAGEQSAGQGVDARDSVAAAQGAASDLASREKCVVAVTGEVDFVTDGRRSAHIHGGSPVMSRITAMGCSLTCLIGSYAAVEKDPFAATVGALTLFAEVGARVAETADGPGSFAWQFLDRLAAIQPEDLDPSRRILS